MNYQTLRVRIEDSVCRMQFYRPEANNTIDNRFIDECLNVLTLCEASVKIVILEGLPEVFCYGADFQEMYSKASSGEQHVHNPEGMYDLLLKIATGPYISISYVRGKANAGGVGIAAASDIVVADSTAQFSLSELIFGLFPACLMPFLVRRIGFQKAHYMSLMTHPVSVQQAQIWGLVDAYDDKSESLLRKHLLRLKYLPKSAIVKYKRYMNDLDDSLVQLKSMAVTANREVFSDPVNQKRIYQFIETGQLAPEDH